ncbi:MAG: T9SS type A sorting domain-containing protein [bacterium]
MPPTFDTNSLGQTGYVNSEICVGYDGSNWTIYTENMSPLFVGATFNVLIINESNTAIGDDKKQLSNISVFPNPASDKVTVQLNGMKPGEVRSISFISADGRTLIERKPDGANMGRVLFDVSTFQPSVYFIRATTADGPVTTKVTLLR